MSSAVTAAEANRNFSKVLGDVREGRTFVITSHGKPVAKIVPFTSHDAVANAAKSTLLARLCGQRGTAIGRWTRDELYED